MARLAASVSPRKRARYCQSLLQSADLTGRALGVARSRDLGAEGRGEFPLSPLEKCVGCAPAVPVSGERR
ncbi:hypothetical protein ACIQNG_33595 [Streptomyces sp. NPDC091377]|uniref:hypothetical protein n=1 Tax=Streptomyces sp. NPDC091377 TaxID=3365995 RepID=UPI0037F307EF